MRPTKSWPDLKLFLPFFLKISQFGYFAFASHSIRLLTIRLPKSIIGISTFEAMVNDRLLKCPLRTLSWYRSFSMGLNDGYSDISRNTPRHSQQLLARGLRNILSLIQFVYDPHRCLRRRFGSCVVSAIAKVGQSRELTGCHERNFTVDHTEGGALNDSLRRAPMSNRHPRQTTNGRRLRKQYGSKQLLCGQRQCHQEGQRVSLLALSGYLSSGEAGMIDSIFPHLKLWKRIDMNWGIEFKTP